ncbi:MAG: cytochrome c3 family protein [Bryobacteraceae bacterium]
MSRVFLLAPVIAFAQDNLILAPPPDSAFPPGPVRLIARVAGESAVKLDGEAVKVESPHPGVVTAELQPAPGTHEITLGDQKVRFAVGKADGFTAFRPHPPSNSCTTCHAVRNGRWRFVRASLSNVCSQCHSKETFPAKHTHQMDLLPDCQLCHNPHGSTAAGHMKLARDAACKQCHSLQK